MFNFPCVTEEDYLDSGRGHGSGYGSGSGIGAIGVDWMVDYYNDPNVINDAGTAGIIDIADGGQFVDEEMQFEDVVT